MIQSSDFKSANDIYIKFTKLELLFESVDAPTLAYFEKEHERHPFSSRKIINKILKLVLLIEGEIQKLPPLFLAYIDYETFEKIANYDKKTIKNNSFKIVRDIYEDFYYLESEIGILNNENTFLLELVVDDDSFLKTRFKINDFLIWINHEGNIFASYWLNRIRNELKIDIDLIELDEEILIKAWELHDKQIRNLNRKILSRSYKKTITNSRMKIYDYRTAFEYIAFLKKESVKYKLPLFDTSINNRDIAKLDQSFKYGITTNKSIRTVRK